MSLPLDWSREGKHWPNREASQFIELNGAKWHIQRIGKGPQMLLLHGTGASTHSWRDVMPQLSTEYDVLAPDLPRHAFTIGHPPEAMSLPAMARELAGLLNQLGFEPHVMVGHSAGAALALEMARSQGFAGAIVGLNAALKPFPGPAAQIFPAIAKLLFVNPLVPRLFSHATTFGKEGDRFLTKSTNSKIDEAGMRCYKTLLANPVHTKGALAMMANWDLPRLTDQLHTIANPVLLVHSTRDNAVPLSAARAAANTLPNARLEVLQGLGHLAHEEDPKTTARLIAEFAQEHAKVAP